MSSTSTALFSTLDSSDEGETATKVFQKAYYNHPPQHLSTITMLNSLLSHSVTISSPEPQAIGAEGHADIYENFEVVQ